MKIYRVHAQIRTTFSFVARKINRRKRSLTIYRSIFIDEIVSEILVAVCLGLNDAYACCQTNECTYIPTCLNLAVKFQVETATYITTCITIYHDSYVTVFPLKSIIGGNKSNLTSLARGISNRVCNELDSKLLCARPTRLKLTRRYNCFWRNNKYAHCARCLEFRRSANRDCRCVD